MNRLTDKNIGMAALHLPEDTEKDFEKRDLDCRRYMKLRDLEDIEEKLGIELMTLFKAISNGIYTTIYKTYVFGNELTIETRNQGFSFKEYECDIVAYFKDYGKTWALTREELE